jgi:hypothetical protein
VEGQKAEVCIRILAHGEQDPSSQFDLAGTQRRTRRVSAHVKRREEERRERRNQYLVLAHGLIDEGEADLLEVGKVAAWRARLVGVPQLKVRDRTRHRAGQQCLLDYLGVLHTLSARTRMCE